MRSNRSSAVVRVATRSLLSGVIAVSLVATSSFIPTIPHAHAQIWSSKKCDTAEVLGCYYCEVGHMSPGTPPAGCTNGKPTGRWQIGDCVAGTQLDQCTWQSWDCGDNRYCATQKFVAKCSPTKVCADVP
jgi:hypothetical protein